MAAMPTVLSGLRVVELSAFVAGPLGGMTLAQLGAEVIRIDPLGGGLDHARWPVTASGASLYWAGLNKGKRSVTVDMSRGEGRALVRRLITAPGEDAGIFVTNVAPRWLDYEDLASDRPDLIMVVLSGSPDGSAAVDYTVNAAVGFPLITGDGAEPSNHVLPAWDVIAGNMVATAVLAAERHRTRTGEGQLVRFTLLDVALATIGHLGFIAEVEINDEDRPALGNYVYGTYGKDFSLADGSRVMVVALTPRQWTALVSATETAADMERFADDHGFDLDSESDRFDAREAISGLLAPWFAARTLPEIRSAFDQAGVCWAPYQTVRTLLASDRNAGVTNPMLRRVAQPGIGTYLAPASPLRFGGAEVPPPLPAPRLGEHTRTVLRAILGLGDDDLDELGSTGVI